MGAAREPNQADFDLERFIDMFDEALTSNDERVVNALRSLMMMVILTKSETGNPMADRNAGPLRQLYDDMRNLNRRMHSIEDELRGLKNMRREEAYQWDEARKYTLTSGSGAFKDQYQDELAKISAQFARKINGGKI